VVQGRPRVGEFLQEELQGSPGVGVVRANPVTGRLLIYHDTALSSKEAGTTLLGSSSSLAAPQQPSPWSKIGPFVRH